MWATPRGAELNIEIILMNEGVAEQSGYFAATFKDSICLTAPTLTELLPMAKAVLAVLRPALIPETKFSSGKSHYVRCTNCAEVGLAEFRDVGKVMMNQPQCRRCRTVTPAVRAKIKKAALGEGKDPDATPEVIEPTT
jgi:hypothetical protein